ncbi:MAG: UDP-N-acetylglucosamine 2-epimerase (non-hydrolyzing) [Actinobacteria bacterium HGW-Actinobacteria-1]|nr:MAG: UDP-N-acetylglucosamine 2-epimerase (non-hydrolyzing) [Actinobacteria bacterium HGW-Actinobacteria-1]
MTRSVLFVFGTRPEAIKMAPVIERVRDHDGLRAVVAVTAQHREMLDQVLELFGIVPDFDLDLMRDRQLPEEVLARAVTALSALIRDTQPDIVLVQGDTTTTLAGALAGFYAHVPVGHLEAGLRTGNLASPFPEEANRRLVSQLAALSFAPTRHAADRLLAEGADPASVIVTGNTVVDAVTEVATRAATLPPELAALVSGERRLAVVTLHRRESWGEPLEQACLGVRDVLDAVSDLVVVLPVHRNPVVSEVVERVLGDHERAVLTDPLGYLEFVQLLKACTIVLSDSGGLQEEAAALGKPLLLLRETTERPEGAEAGTLKLVGTDRSAIARETQALLSDADAYRAMSEAPNPFGDGRASERIVAAIEEFLA